MRVRLSQPQRQWAFPPAPGHILGSTVDISGTVPGGRRAEHSSHGGGRASLPDALARPFGWGGRGHCTCSSPGTICLAQHRLVTGPGVLRPVGCPELPPGWRKDLRRNVMLRVSSMLRGRANLLRIDPVLVLAPPKSALTITGHGSPPRRRTGVRGHLAQATPPGWPQAPGCRMSPVPGHCGPVTSGTACARPGQQGCDSDRRLSTRPSRRAPDCFLNWVTKHLP